MLKALVVHFNSLTVQHFQAVGFKLTQHAPPYNEVRKFNMKAHNTIANHVGLYHGGKLWGNLISRLRQEEGCKPEWWGAAG